MSENKQEQYLNQLLKYVLDREGFGSLYGQIMHEL